jgi:hypothetical protein
MLRLEPRNNFPGFEVEELDCKGVGEERARAWQWARFRPIGATAGKEPGTHRRYAFRVLTDLRIRTNFFIKKNWLIQLEHGWRLGPTFL